MISMKPTTEFTAWLDGLADITVCSVIVARIKRLALGLTGDVAPVGKGISELRIHVGAGWRIYFVQHGTQVIAFSGRRLKTHPKGRYQAGEEPRFAARLK